MIFPHGYGEIPNVISLTDKLTDTQRRVWCYHYIRGMQHGKATAKPERVAKDLNLKSVEVVRRVNRALKAFGLMEVEPDEDGVDVYRLLDIPTSFSGLDEVIQLQRNKRKEERAAQPAQPASEPKPAGIANLLEHPAIRIFKEVTSYYPTQKVEGLREEITATVTDLDLWRRILERHKAEPWVTQSMDILKAYRDVTEGTSTAQTRPSGGTPITLNGDWERRLRKRQQAIMPKEEGVSSNTLEKAEPPAVATLAAPFNSNRRVSNYADDNTIF